MGVGGQPHAPAALPPGKTRYPLYRRLVGPQDRSGRVWKISPPTGIRSSDRPARSKSLYRLSYPSPHFKDSVAYFTQSRPKGKVVMVENGDNRLGGWEWKITGEKPKECRYWYCLDRIWRSQRLVVVMNLKPLVRHFITVHWRDLLIDVATFLGVFT